MRGLVFLIAAAVAAAPAMADKPEWAGGGKGGDHGQKGASDKGRNEAAGRDRAGREASIEKHFDHNRHVAVRDYYAKEFQGGKCPPGLAKKHNGCMPPGQAKKWKMGQPLPREVVIYDLPPQLVVKIGVPPAGYKYVRVASDILMIAVGTSMVVDAIHDLGGM